MRQQKVSKTETLYFDYPQNLKKGVSYLKVDHNPQPIEAT